ncbi:MAG TPA: ECF subfamily RNA polymerase sigma factor, BldN family [Mycobacteriales bacterium]
MTGAASWAAEGPDETILRALAALRDLLVTPDLLATQDAPLLDETPRRRPSPFPARGTATVRPPVGPGGPTEDDPVWKLVERARDGDSGAFGQLYDRYVDTVYRYLYYRVGNRQLAEDLTSETFLRALRRIGSVTWQGRDLGAWLVTIARNLAADHFKSSRFRLEVTTADMRDADQLADGPEREVLDALTNATLLQAVKRLNAEQQECIVLRFINGMSVTETAQAMGKNDGAIKALQYRAVRTLGRLLPEGFTP